MASQSTQLPLRRRIIYFLFLLISEFVELIKAGLKLEAVKHARKHLATDDPEHLPTIQKGMALLAFSGDTTIQPYRELLDEDR